jgi:erythromycin esterase-like protein
MNATEIATRIDREKLGRFTEVKDAMRGRYDALRKKVGEASDELSAARTHLQQCELANINHLPRSDRDTVIGGDEHIVKARQRLAIAMAQKRELGERMQAVSDDMQRLGFINTCVEYAERHPEPPPAVSNAGPNVPALTRMGRRMNQGASAGPASETDR